MSDPAIMMDDDAIETVDESNQNKAELKDDKD